MFRTFALITLSLLAISCGKGSDKDETLSCHRPSNNLSGCCSSHGGPKTCGEPGDYIFTGGGRLICADGTTSPTCKGVY